VQLVNILASQLSWALAPYRSHSSCDRWIDTAIQALCDALAEGHVCLDLSKLAGQYVGGELMPSLNVWRDALRSSSLVAEVSDSSSSSFKPFILDQNHRFYLHRYYYYEQSVVDRLRVLAQSEAMFSSDDVNALRRLLDHLFDQDALVLPPSFPNLQKVAAASAVLQRVCIISGGPGTGKTTTVVRLLAALQSLNGASLEIRLVAPTGKAAARMGESIRVRKPSLAVDSLVLDAIPETAETVHRLLGVRYGSSTFRHHRGRPLALDVLVVDEASMIDLALMAKLLEALPDHARLILLGDKDQLDSVEAGSVFAELCSLKAYTSSFLEQLEYATGLSLDSLIDSSAQQNNASSLSTPSSLMSNAVVTLTHSFRFGTQPGIGALARYANEGKGAQAVECLCSGEYADSVLEEGSHSTLLKRLDQGFEHYWQAIDQHDIQEAFKALGAFRVLVVNKQGEYSAEWLNRKYEEWLSRKRKVASYPLKGMGWYAGKPIMVLENDYAQQLFNGDVGIVLRYQDELRVAFEGDQGKIRWVNPARLPRYEESYAMTVHKSQGSEFEEVLFLLPAQWSPILTRNLIYTGITRAKKKVSVWGSAALLERAIHSAPVRYSGLADAIANVR
jgi:exodeoxyribonuclease V alpha subunit